MSTKEKLIYGWTMHLLQVGRYGPDFKTLINHHCYKSPATWPFISLYLKQNSIIQEIGNSGPSWGNEWQVLDRLLIF